MSKQWNEGYVSEIDYTRGYYPELSPARAQFALTLAGYAAPAIEHACELGYGLGTSINMHAAAGMASWHGTDFNPGQALHAQQLAVAGGTGRIELLDQGFEEYCARHDLPMFDYIGLHGIYSWISERNRKAIVQFVLRRLKPGGVLYISYNAMPGWSAFAPLRHLMKMHADSMSPPALGVSRRMDAAIQFADRLLHTNPAYAKANATVAGRLEKLKALDRNYLVHEYLNDNWNPLRFDECAAELGHAKLSYACSASLTDHVDALNLTPAQQQLLAEAEDPVLRETLRDYCVNQQFRRDYWLKGPRKMGGAAHAHALRGLRLVQVMAPSQVSYHAAGALGTADLQAAIYQPVVELMSDHRPRTLGEIEQHFAGKGGPTLMQLAQVATLLVANATLQVAQPDGAIAAARKTAAALNRHLLQRTLLGDPGNYLASPVTGGGIPVTQVSQLFLMASLKGLKQPGELAHFAWEALSRFGQRLIHAGKVLETVEENRARLHEDAGKFLADELPILKALAML